ncbi:MAG TPA: hypothetical protein GXX23_07135 [Firmicutes bacterium]|nr:hypothetical protein [Candidatus Fermentithermobacillaceae bacterium]
MRDRQVRYLNRLANTIAEMLYLDGLDLDTLSDLTTILWLIGQRKARLAVGEAEESAPHAGEGVPLGAERQTVHPPFIEGQVGRRRPGGLPPKTPEWVSREGGVVPEGTAPGEIGWF